jgi:hypothetical protein
LKKVYRIHPAIGIARLGDSPADYFVGPEAPGVLPLLNQVDEPSFARGNYKDEAHRIKRQGARFRVYEYTYDSSKVLQGVREITVAEGRVEWSVHLANGKAAGPRFDDTGRRNKGVPVKDLIIDAKLQKISGSSRAPKRLQGKFIGVTVPLGDLLTDRAGRLVVLGGFGHSQSVPAGRILTDFANNDGWCDDSSDGPVRASIKLHGTSTKVEAEPAWVIVGPPDFAPEIENVITLYDVVLDVAAKLHPALDIRAHMPVSFTAHIYPILKRATLNIWVNYLARRGHGPESEAYFLAPELLALLSDNAPAPHHALARHGARATLPMHGDHDGDLSTAAGRRQHTFEHLRKPQGGGGDMPMLNPQRGPGAPALTDLQYKLMERWAAGDFVSDWPGFPPTALALDQLPAQDQPAALDRAALDACVGAAFYPGIEAGMIMSKKTTYDPKRPFRIASRLGPGALTEGMSVPWQADFRECSTNWWPAQRPNEVYRDGANPGHWVPTTWRRETMVARWSQLGFVVKKTLNGQDRFVEDERNV